MEETTKVLFENLSTEDLMRRLAVLRKYQAQYVDGQRSMIEEVKQSHVYRILESARQQAEDEMRDLDIEIRRRAVAAFDGTNKKPWPGVSIKIKLNARLTDEAAALAYAVEHAPELIKLDTAQFERLARQLYTTPHELPFYEFTSAPVAEIARDLSQYLQRETEPAAVDQPEEGL